MKFLNATISKDCKLGNITGCEKEDRRSTYYNFPIIIWNVCVWEFCVCQNFKLSSSSIWNGNQRDWELKIEYVWVIVAAVYFTGIETSAHGSKLSLCEAFFVKYFEFSIDSFCVESQPTNLFLNISDIFLSHQNLRIFPGSADPWHNHLVGFHNFSENPLTVAKNPTKVGFTVWSLVSICS